MPHGIAVGPLTGVAVGLLTALAGGSLGAHRLAELGPNPLLTGLVAAGEVAVVATLTAVLATWLIRRRHARPSGGFEDSAAVGDAPDEVGRGERQA